MSWTKGELIEAVARQRARTVELAKSLSDAEWAAPALPGWTVKHVIAHLVASDAGGLNGRLLVLAFKKSSDGGLSNVEAWNEREVKRWVDRPDAELVDGLEKWGRRIGRVLRIAPRALLNMRAPLPFGRVPVKFLGIVRVLDEWIHEQDILRALGRDYPSDPAAVRAAARAMIEVIPLQTPARIANGAVGTVLLRLDGGGLPSLAGDLSTGTFAKNEGPSDAVVTADAAAMLMIAGGRDGWADAEQKGLLKIEGERPVAEAFLAAVRAA